jgi:hypothetical protein
MSDKAIRDELAKLREQVAELHTTRAQATAPEEHQEAESAPENKVMPQSGDPEHTSILAENEETQDAEQQIRDFVEALDKEIKSTNPMTVLVVFSLGVLIGRLLPR